jgi:hypothetical protein
VDYAAPAISVDRNSITIPAGMVKIIDLVYTDEYGALTHHFLEWQMRAAQYGRQSFFVIGDALSLSDAIPTSIPDANVKVRGYRLPTLLTDDASLCDVPPEYLIYTAAFMLEAGDAAGPQRDPEQHAGRAGNWFRRSQQLEASLRTRWEPNTQPLEAVTSA